MSTTQKVAIVTGASQGIGAALVVGYRKLGYAVAATSRSIGASDDPDVLTVPGDLSQPGTGADIVDQTLARFGRIDTLVNNAGIFVAKPFTADYYDSQPAGMTAAYRILETRRLADNLVLGYLSVDFSFIDRPTLTVYLSVLVKDTPDGVRISHYQVSRLG
jgi:NAD(P)-dependent dehydrogenase (short-subunit alcohol dehydrogenase family)